MKRTDLRASNSLLAKDCPKNPARRRYPCVRDKGVLIGESRAEFLKTGFMMNHVPPYLPQDRIVTLFRKAEQRLPHDEFLAGVSDKLAGIGDDKTVPARADSDRGDQFGQPVQ